MNLARTRVHTYAVDNRPTEVYHNPLLGAWTRGCLGAGVCYGRRFAVRYDDQDICVVLGWGGERGVYRGAFAHCTRYGSSRRLSGTLARLRPIWRSLEAPPERPMLLVAFSVASANPFHAG